MLRIQQLESTTPTLAAAMASCFLGVGLSRAPGNRTFVLGNPKAWLGTAFHEVLEHMPVLIADTDSTEEIWERAESRWNEAIARLEHEASLHPLNRRFGQARTWRGYFLTLETLRIRVAELSEDVGRRKRVLAGRIETSSRIAREDEFTSQSGKLRGRVDLLRGDEIVDFKTGTLFETEDAELPPTVKAAYVRQIQIYAFLVHDVTGRWPRIGLLYPIAGPPVAIEIDPAQCEDEAIKAVELLDRYNLALVTGNGIHSLASPSPASCRWCPFKAICPAFWENVDESWASSLDGGAVAGRLSRAPQAVHGNSASSIGLIIETGTEQIGELSVSPLNSAFHPNVTMLANGDRLRIVGLGRRANGTVYPTQRTVVTSDADIPIIELPKPGKS